LTAQLDPEAKTETTELTMGANREKHCATEAARCLQNDTWWRALRKRWRPKRLETGAASKGEARRETKNPTNNRLRR